MVRRPAMQDRIAAGILDSAAVVLAERGESASMAEIAKATGVGRATLYRYFPTRDALLAGLAAAAVTELRDRIADAQLDAVPVAEGLARLTRGFMAASRKYAALIQTGKKHIKDIDELDKQVAAPVRDLLQRGIDDGTLRGDLPVTVLFEMYTGMLERGLHLLTRGEVGIEQVAAAITTMFLNGAISQS